MCPAAWSRRSRRTAVTSAVSCRRRCECGWPHGPPSVASTPHRRCRRMADMDVQDKLAQIIRLVEDARAMPMSASCLVNREEMLAELDELRALLPEQLQQADVVLSDRDAVVERGRDA